MRFRPANISLINRRHYLPRLLLTLSLKYKNKNHPTDSKMLTGSHHINVPYRLPSESEWEYAARAGTATRFWWGDDDKVAADFAWFKDNSGNQPHSVGLKPANPFGLYDIVGNVWQWTEDCYAERYTGVPTEGNANEVGKDCLRSDRGGSWLYPAWLLRPATRERNPANYRDMIMGFRLAMTFP